MITGSFASNLYGVPRATQDADVVIKADQGSPPHNPPPRILLVSAVTPIPSQA